MGDERLVVALEGGKGLMQWRLQDVMDGNVGLGRF
jgi:hypothetical protein